jgi:hypothetical protein
MGNKHLAKPPIDLMLARLKVLFESINDSYQSGRMVLESDIISSYQDATELFYQSLDSSIVDVVTRIYKGAPADPSQMNIFTSAIQKDLQASFAEIAALDRLIAASFNSLISEREQVLQSSKNISNKLADYLLYADPSLGAGYFFGDSFNTANKIEISSSLVEGEECFYDTNEGVVLLPLDGEPERPKIKSFIINKPSNGMKGSNYQLDIFGHDSLEVIGDGEPNTWFEYEKVAAYESNTPLILDLTIVLDEISVINHININPINFGTPSPIKISILETSKDGIEYVSIKDEVPIKDFVSEEEDNVFELSPATSKNSGQGFYSFLPRKVQYVHVVFQQHTPYSITTNSGTRLRYAIGLRDINIFGRKFKTSGSIVSSRFTIDGNARKVSLWASENPVEPSTLSDISHFLTHNDGATWSQIQPQERTTHKVPEIINFNTIADNSINTEETVDTFRHKISMTRDTKAFKGDAIIKQEKLDAIDVVSVPAGGSFDVSVNETPIPDSLRVVMPYMGSFSCPRERSGEAVVNLSPPMDLDRVEFNVDVSAAQTVIENDETKIYGTVYYRIPFRNVPDLEHKIRVFHNSAQIEYMSKDEDKFTSDINEYSKIYFLNKQGTELQFGHIDSNGTQRGFIPEAGSKVEVCLDGDNPFLSLTDRGYVLNLTLPSDGEKDTVSIVSLADLSEREVEDHEIEIPPGVNKVKPDTSTVTEKQNQVGNTLRPPDKIINPTINPNVGAQTTKQAAGGVKKESNFRDNPSTSSAGKYGDQEPSVLPPDKEANPQELEDEIPGFGTFFREGQDGMLPPIFLETGWVIYEYELSDPNVPIEGASRQYTTPVDFVDGDSELRDSGGNMVSSRYTFDHTTGAVYLGSAPAHDRRTVLSCKKTNLAVIPTSMWNYDQNIVTNKVDTRKILLDPRAVITMKQIVSFTFAGDNTKSISLVSGNERSHDWFNKKIVKGSIKPDSSLFPEGAKPVEVPFIDGSSELSNIIKVVKEPITFTSASNEHSFTLQRLTSSYPNNSLIGTPSFAAVRTNVSASSPTNIFDETLQKPSGTPLSSEGEWKIETVSGSIVITVYSTSTPGSHTVSYRYSNSDPGVDRNGLYSVDYNNGIIYFSEEIPADGNVLYEVSEYSAFYNIGEPVVSGDIIEIDETNKSVKFSTAFGMRFLKQDVANRARPQYMKIFYQYYKNSTESLVDLEQYFSPICKDVAFRAVTADTLEEL